MKEKKLKIRNMHLVEILSEAINRNKSGSVFCVYGLKVFSQNSI